MLPLYLTPIRGSLAETEIRLKINCTYKGLVSILKAPDTQTAVAHGEFVYFNLQPLARPGLRTRTSVTPMAFATPMPSV